MTKPRQHPYERELEVSYVWLDHPLTPLGEIAWEDYLLNPRQLRGSDFLMRWAQGVWSEQRMLQAMNENGRYLCVEYGPSGVAPEGDPRAFELYFERLEHAGLGDVKRPDLMIFNRSDSNLVSEIIEGLGGGKELPFIRESEPQMKKLLALAIMGIECENSLWKSAQMPAFGA